MNPLRFSLQADFHQPIDPGRPYFMNASVQIWCQDEYLTTIKILDLAHFMPQADIQSSCIEHWASIAAHTLAHQIDTELDARVSSARVHLTDYILKEFSIDTGLSE